MASNHAVVARTIREFVSGNLAPDALARKFAVIARGRRDEVIRSGEASASYQTFVDGREGAAEETTRPGGAVVYRFNLMGMVVRRALGELVNMSPEKSGDFKDSFVVSVNGSPWTKKYDDIPVGSDVVIVNVTPYSRKIETGAMTMNLPKTVFERARQRLLRAFPSMFFGKTFVTLPPSFSRNGYETPYILAGHAHRIPVQQSRRSSAFRQGKMFLAPRKDTMKGQQLTYPALTISLSR